MEQSVNIGYSIITIIFFFFFLFFLIFIFRFSDIDSIGLAEGEEVKRKRMRCKDNTTNRKMHFIFGEKEIEYVTSVEHVPLPSLFLC